MTTPLPLAFQDIDGQLDSGRARFPQLAENPGLMTIDDTRAWLAHHQRILNEVLRLSGAILFRGFPVMSAGELDEFISAFDYPTFTADTLFTCSDENKITSLPERRAIALHNELADSPLAPSKVFLYCEQVSEGGGNTALCQADKVFAALANTAPDVAEALRKHGVRYSRTLHAYSWRDVLGVNHASEAESKLRQFSYQWHWLENGDIRITSPVVPAVIALSEEQSTLFSLILTRHPAGGEKHYLTGTPPDDITYGDGEPITQETTEMISAICEQFTFRLRWQEGDVLLLDNYLTMHGHSAVSSAQHRLLKAVYGAD